jgi:UDP-glucose-4-epimerase GalE
MTILVTGGAGYIGSHTVRLLRDRGRDVVALDSMEFGHRPAVGNVALVEADIADAGAVRGAVEQHEVDVVIHFGAYKAPGESMLRPGRYFENNVAKSARLIQTLCDVGVERFVFSSSCAVYGTPDDVPVTETAALRPESPYGESKAITENMLSWYDRCAGLRSVSLRYFNAAGAWPDGSIGEEWTHTINLVPLVMKAALGRSGPLRVFGADYPTADGSAIRDYVHVVDLADAHVRAVEYLEAGGVSTICNLGTGVGTSVFEILQAAERVIGRPVPYEVTRRRPGDPVALFADTRRSKELLHWIPDREIGDILSSAWAWHSTHLDGYDD